MEDNAKHHILIVDDDKFLIDMYSIKFSEHGFQVDTAMDGEEALEKLAAGLKPDIFLVDVLMPKIDGFELINRLKEKQYSAHSVEIILSNLGQQEDIDKGLGLGVDGYIIKASATPTEVVNKTVEITNSKLRRSSGEAGGPTGMSELKE